MGFQKNVTGQKWMVFAFNRNDNTPVTGDAANITGKLRLDYAAAAGITDTNPTEIEDGYYEFDLTQAETNADVIDILPESSTSNVQVIGVPGRVFTVSPNYNEALVRIIASIEHQRGAHTHQPSQGNMFFVDPVNGDTHANGNRGGPNDPYAGIQDCHDNAITDSNHDTIILVAGAAAGATTLTETITLTKRYLFIRGPGRDFIITRSGNGNTIDVTADGIEISGCQISTASGAANGNAVNVTSSDFFALRKVWITEAADEGVEVTVGSHYVIEDCVIHTVSRAILINSGGGSTEHGIIRRNHIYQCTSHGINLTGTDAARGTISDNFITDIGDDGILLASGADNCVVVRNSFGNITNENVDDNGTNNVVVNNEQWSTVTDNSVADNVLQRNITNVELTAPEHSLCTVVLAMLESSISGGTWTIRRTDASTHVSKTVTTDAAADPITSVT